MLPFHTYIFHRHLLLGHVCLIFLSRIMLVRMLISFRSICIGLSPGSMQFFLTAFPWGNPHLERFSSNAILLSHMQETWHLLVHLSCLYDYPFHQHWLVYMHVFGTFLLFRWYSSCLPSSYYVFCLKTEALHTMSFWPAFAWGNHT